MATRTYEKGDLTVFWDSTRCIHTGICLRSLHSVFNLKNRPWVNLDDGDVEQIIATVEKCPTGAAVQQRRQGRTRSRADGDCPHPGRPAARARRPARARPRDG